MIHLAGADLVLPDRVAAAQTIVIDGDRIVALESGSRGGDRGARLDLHDHYVVPGFVDVHLHGLAGRDCLEGEPAIRSIAAALPRHGVTAFCPTSVACPPETLRAFLAGVSACRAERPAQAARVLPAHLESNFINPDYRGAQPIRCLRLPPDAPRPPGPDAEYGAGDIVAEIERARADVGVVTLAPELPGAPALIRRLVAWGHRVSLGHSAATFDEAQGGIAAGASRATHLFNRMPPLGHRDPGLAGAVLASEEVAAEVICDGRHVHPAVVRMAVAAKHPSRAMAISDATAGAGLGEGGRASLGGETITVRQGAAYLDDGTLAGGVATMIDALRLLVGPVGLSVVDAVHLCATTPARELGLHGFGVIAPGAKADLTILDRQFVVRRTFVGGRLAYSAPGLPPVPAAL